MNIVNTKPDECILSLGPATYKDPVWGDKLIGISSSGDGECGQDNKNSTYTNVPI